MDIEEIKEIEEELKLLPKGYISNKVIGNKVRHYLQWNENGKIKSIYIPDENYELVKKSIDRRKYLQGRLKEIKINSNFHRRDIFSYDYEMNAIYGRALKELVSKVSNFKKRSCYDYLKNFIYGEETPRVCCIYGLRRTGKTTLLFQIINDMNSVDLKRAVYIKARKNQTMDMLDRDLKKLYENGYKYVFLDEITFLDDFIDTASFLSDIYAGMGMKIVLSGTDSLGFWFAEREELYDRCFMIHTTWIPYKEHSELLNINNVDDYIRYGGTLRAGENDFDDNSLKSEEVSFLDDESTRRYIDSSICKNIQHSLKCYDNGLHFRYLRELFEADELTGVINRIIENTNHRFVIRVLTEKFKSNDLLLTKKNILREKNPKLRTDILTKIDINEVTKRLMEILEIKNTENMKITIQEEHVKEIEEYLRALELIADFPIRYGSFDIGKENRNKLFLQPGMRFCQAEALVYSLKKDSLFMALNSNEKDYVCNRILDEVRGRMLEEIVIYETIRKIGKEFEVFKLQFDVGEFDMVVFNKQESTCKIYEIKHSDKQIDNQFKNIVDLEKCKITEEIYGEITDRIVLYNGEDISLDNGVKYINVSTYLKLL